jgi:hypothetical protein
MNTIESLRRAFIGSDTCAQLPAMVKSAGAMSIGMRIDIVDCGRLIGFVKG